MSIQLVQDGQTLKSVREDSINPTINKVNAMEVELDAVEAIASGNTSQLNTLTNKTQALDAFISNVHENVTEYGQKYKVDHRVFDFTATSSRFSVVVPLESGEFPVRAVVRTFTNNTGTFYPVADIEYNRTTQELSFNVGSHRNGKIYCEFWAPL